MACRPPSRVSASAAVFTSSAGFSATATIKRSDYGMNAYLPDLGDEVKLYIESEANL